MSREVSEALRRGLGRRFPLVPALLAASGAPRELHLLGLPIDLGIVLLEPGVPEDRVLPPEIGDCQENPLCVTSVPEDHIHNFSDQSSLVRGAINIEYGDRSGEALGCNPVSGNKVPVDERPGGSAVNKGSGAYLGTRVGGA